MTTSPTFDRRVLQLWRKFGNRGATTDQVCAVYGLKHQCVSAAAARLKRRDALTSTGITRRTRQGRPALVWRVRA